MVGARLPIQPATKLATAIFAVFAGLAVACSDVSVSFAAGANSPEVAVTIKPIHSLAAMVMEGVGTPALLISGADSPHTHAVRPSEARILERADILFWVGPDMESSFVRPIATLVHGKVVAMLQAPGITVLPIRPAGDLTQSFEAAREPAARGAEPDPHIWLDPENAIAMTRDIADVLTEADPAHAATYAANAAKAEKRLAALDAELREKLAPVKHVPFIPYHDAYQYLERRYGLRAVASVTLAPEQAPGAKRIAALRKLIMQDHVACVFTEPEFQPAIVRTVVEGTGAKVATLDPEGAPVPGGPDFYFTLMRRIAADLTACLAPGHG